MKRAGKKRKKNALTEQVIIRCTAEEKARWFAEAEKAPSGEFSEWAREQLGLACRDQ